MRMKKPSKLPGIIIGLIFIGFGLWGVIAGEYSSEGYRWRDGLKLEGYPAVVVGAVCLLFGLYVLYLVSRHRE